MPEANGEISNEFFKKLNQQIVQKDNLIKLLQLQIRNLKNQIESGEADAEKSDDLQKALEQKNTELEGLRSELEEQKKLCDSIGAEKDEQIRSLNEMLEQKSMTVADYADDPKIADLEEQIRKIQSDYQNSLEELNNVKIQNAELSESNTQLQNQMECMKGSFGDSNEELEQLRALVESKDSELASKTSELEAKTAELQDKTTELNAKTEELAAMPEKLVASNEEAVRRALDEASAQNLNQLNQIALEAETYKNQVIELTRKVEELESDVATKERSQLDASDELNKTNENLAAAEGKIARLEAEAEKVEDLTRQLEVLQGEKDQFAEVAMKLTAAENDIERLNGELEKTRAELISQPQKNEYMLQVSQLEQTVNDKEDEINLLRKALEARLSEGVPASGEDTEALAMQIAEQTVTIQAYEQQIREVRRALNEKETELNIVKNKMSELEANSNRSDEPVNITDANDMIASFVEFFDGLDNALSKNPDPELQGLHKKLMEKLIIPNKISYVPVISEEYDPNLHVATDYFRSTKFPERCIVFEVEKGYKKGDNIIKKPRVWVVQNLFKCSSCGTEQTNPESRFCHLCGAKILAPNNLPIDSMPVFEPTATTYNRFTERMLEKGNLSKAKEYIEAGLELDPNSVPLILSMADLLISESKFQEAVDYLKHAYELKPDDRTKVKIGTIETKLNIFSQAKNLKLSNEEFDKLLHIIQK